MSERQNKIKAVLYNDHYTIYNGSMLDLLQVIEPNTIDAVVTDPPYEINFMNKGWDNNGISFKPDTWTQCYEVLKPGGYLLAFGGSRTFHRIAVVIEDAGFEIRDTIMWLYGSGFPKSMNISKALEAKEKYGKTNTVVKKQVEQSGNGKEYKIKQTNNGAMGEIVETTRKVYIPSTELAKQWQGWGTALKPAYEPIIVARKPFKGSLVDNVLTYGVGGLNIDECRIETETRTVPIHSNDIKTDNTMFGLHPTIQRERVETNIGRFPANVIHDGSDEVESLFPYTKSGKMTNKHQRHTDGSPNGIYGKFNKEHPLSETYGDSGSASRFFYTAKASKKDRDEGLESFDEQIKVFNGKSKNVSKDIKDVEKRFTTVLRNIHPTVKPTELMQYLVRLVAPKGATILDPFMGSGSTGKAVMFENRERNANYKFIGIDLAEEYCKIADARIDYALNKYEYEKIKQKEKDTQEGKISIFDLI